MTTFLASLFGFLLGLSIIAHAQETNATFLPEYGSDQQQAVAIAAGECRPVELDPEGHWGEISCGFQMSIRSATNVFVSGSSMTVAVILRNTTTNGLLRTDDYNDSQTVLYAQDETNNVTRSPMPAGSRLDFIELAPRQQVKFKYDLNWKFHLAPGIYKIHAEQAVLSPGSTIDHLKYDGHVSSGILTIKVIPP